MHLAQLNIARSLHPMDDPRMDGFTGRVNEINALADRTPGFVWRMVDDDDSLDGALSLRLPGDMHTLVNMSVWENIENLSNFIYQTAHKKVMKSNRDNFEKMSESHYVLWWIEKGHIPSLAEAKVRLDQFRAHGPAPAAFNFKTAFDAEGAPFILRPTNIGVVADQYS